MRNILSCLIVAILFFVTGCSDSSNNSPTTAELLSRYTLSSPDSIPEGIAFDPVERAFYVTSLQGGSITRIDADGSESLFRQADDRARIAGAKIDADKRLLWVCAKFVDGVDDRVWVLDLNTGELVQEYLLGALTSGGACNDLTLTDEGEIAYVSDSSNPFIYRLNALTGEGSILATDPLFVDITGQGIGINGLVVSPDGTALIIVKSFPSQMFRVSLPDGESISQVSLSGDALASTIPDTPLGDIAFGGDGLALLGGYVYVVTPSAVSRVLLAKDYASGKVVTIPQIDGIGLTTATVAGDALYVIKSEAGPFALDRPIDLPFEFFRVNLDAFDVETENL